MHLEYIIISDSGLKLRSVQSVSNMDGCAELHFVRHNQLLLVGHYILHRNIRLQDTNKILLASDATDSCKNACNVQADGMATEVSKKDYHAVHAAGTCHSGAHGKEKYSLV